VNPISITKNNVVAVVVTYNRKYLLIQCVKSLLNQSVPCDIIIVDNASTDGTKSCLQENGMLEKIRIHYLELHDNIGGAGGFNAGMKYGMSSTWDWCWLMDDDAIAHKDALRYLRERGIDKNAIYGSAAIGETNGQKKYVLDRGISG